MTSSRPSFHIQPQRTSARGWTPCLEHEAQRFAVLRSERKGRTVLTRTATHAPTRREAQLLRDSLEASHKPFRAKAKKVIATSLSQAHYLHLKSKGLVP